MEFPMYTSSERFVEKILPETPEKDHVVPAAEFFLWKLLWNQAPLA